MSLSAESLRREASSAGFRPETLEKVDRLLDLLELIQRHPYLKSRLALKGGTALNLFVFDVPRLSVDIDVNYIGALDRETMLAERQPLESVDDVRMEPRELRNQLLPVLSVRAFRRPAALEEWATRLIDECRDALSVVLPLSEPEREFLDRLLNHGEIRQALLGVDQRLTELVQQHPALLWKAFNIRGNAP